MPWNPLRMVIPQLPALWHSRGLTVPRRLSELCGEVACPSSPFARADLVGFVVGWLFLGTSRFSLKKKKGFKKVKTVDVHIEAQTSLSLRLLCDPFLFSRIACLSPTRVHSSCWFLVVTAACGSLWPSLD